MKGLHLPNLRYSRTFRIRTQDVYQIWKVPVVGRSFLRWQFNLTPDGRCVISYSKLKVLMYYTLCLCLYHLF